MHSPRENYILKGLSLHVIIVEKLVIFDVIILNWLPMCIKVRIPILGKIVRGLLYIFDVLAITRVVCSVALQKYEIDSQGNVFVKNQS